MSCVLQGRQRREGSSGLGAAQLRPALQHVTATAGHKEEQHARPPPPRRQQRPAGEEGLPVQRAGRRSRLRSVPPPLFFVPFSLLFLLLPGSSRGECDALSI